MTHPKHNQLVEQDSTRVSLPPPLGHTLLPSGIILDTRLMIISLEKPSDLNFISDTWHTEPCSFYQVLSRLTAPFKEKIITFLNSTLLEEGRVLQQQGMQIRLSSLKRTQPCFLPSLQNLLQLTPQKSDTPGRELNHELISIQLLPKAHLRHLIAGRDGLICRLTSHSARLSKFSPSTRLVQHKATFVPYSNSASYRNSFTHLRFMPTAFIESGSKKHPFKQSRRGFCKTAAESTVHYVIQCP